jgi:uncharacterized protein (TIGR03435 family)
MTRRFQPFLGAIIAMSLTSLVQAVPQVGTPANSPPFVGVRPTGGTIFEGGIVFGPTVKGGEFGAKNFPVRSLLSVALGRITVPIFGAPDWFYLDGFDIAVRMLPGEDLRATSMRILADGFKVSMHYETRRLYMLALANEDGGLGPNTKAWNAPCIIGSIGPPRRLSGTESPADLIRPLNEVPCGQRSGVGVYSAGGITFQHLANALTHELNVVVQDATHQAGQFVVVLQWLSDSRPESANLPSLGQALRDQLGLQLRATERDADVLVIDHVERPLSGESPASTPVR